MKHLSIAVLIIIATGCAHHRDVRPSSTGVHKVILKTDEKDQGYNEAMSQAEDFCEKRYKKHPVIVNEDSQYKGKMKEDKYNEAKTATKVVQGVGAAGWVFGGKNESNLGGIVGLGGGIADAALGQGYSYELNFKCE